jgi:hypothetical protein
MNEEISQSLAKSIKDTAVLDKVSDYISNFLQLIDDKIIKADIAKEMVVGALNSKEVYSEEGLEAWLKGRFIENSIMLDKDDYSKALIRALWLAPNLASQDFVGGRRRDFAQLWTDTARGFLGEIAVQKFLKKNFDFNMVIDTRRGNVKNFVSTDVHIEENGVTREPKAGVSIKTTKFSGRWYELVESQFNVSGVFALVKLGISRYHFIAYLKSMETIQRIFKKGMELGELNEDQVKKLSEEIPESTYIPAYIPGFVKKSDLNLPIHYLKFKLAKKRSGEQKELRIEEAVGLLSDQEIRNREDIRSLGLNQSTPIVLDGIGKKVDGKFYASSGQLKFGKGEWSRLLNDL